MHSMFHASTSNLLCRGILISAFLTTVHCYINKEQDTISETYFTFFTGGIPEILWRKLGPDLQRQPLTRDLSPACLSSLAAVYDGLHQGSLSSYQFIDASGKSPPGLLDGTMVSFGDFDLCLEIQEPIVSQYCLLQINVKDTANSTLMSQEIHQEMRVVSPLLNFFHPRIGICLPAMCTSHEVIRLLRHRLRSHPVSVTSTISCQTKSTLDDRMSRLTLPQKASLIGLLFLISLSFISLVAERLGIQTSGPLSSFSLRRNTIDLFKHQPGRSMTVDYLKLSFSLMFVSMHAIGGSDNPYSPMMLSRMRQALRDSNRFELQIFFSDTLGDIMFLMSGFVTVYSLFSVIRSGSFSPARHLLLKWSKLIPLIFSLMALEFVWPLVGSGPFYAEVSDFVLNNCQKYWWANVLLIANYFPSLEKCAPQLFYSSVDFQLCIPAVAAILLFRRSYKAGIAFITLIILLCLISTIYIASRFQVIPNYVSRDADVRQRMIFMDYIHLPANTHAPAYFIGFLIGYKSVTKTQILISDQLRAFLTYLCYLCTLLAALGPALYNTFQILPLSLVPYYIVIQKLMYIMVLFPVLMKLRK